MSNTCTLSLSLQSLKLSWTPHPYPNSCLPNLSLKPDAPYKRDHAPRVLDADKSPCFVFLFHIFISETGIFKHV